VRVQIKFPGIDTTLLKTFDETDSLAAVVDFAKEVNLVRLMLWCLFGFTRLKKKKERELP
jgi:hypothetical protein